MPILLEPAFILHRRPYRDTSLLLDLLTQEHGRLALVARGVRTRSSRLRFLLQPFVPILVSWQGKTELKTLISAEPLGPPLSLQGRCLFSGFYLNELLVRVLQKEDPHPSLYFLYQHTLAGLQSPVLQEKILRLFEKRLLAELGYALQLEKDCVTGEPVLENCFYHYYPEQGIKLNKEFPHQGGFKGKSLLSLAHEQLVDTDSLRDAKRLIREAFITLLNIESFASRKLFLSAPLNFGVYNY